MSRGEEIIKKKKKKKKKKEGMTGGNGAKRLQAVSVPPSLKRINFVTFSMALQRNPHLRVCLRVCLPRTVQLLPTFYVAT